MTQRTSIHGLHVATPLYRFIEDQVLPAVGVKSKTFWSGFDAIVKIWRLSTLRCWPSAIAFNWKWTSGTPPTLARLRMPEP